MKNLRNAVIAMGLMASASLMAADHGDYRTSMMLSGGQVSMEDVSGMNFGLDMTFEGRIIESSFGDVYVGAGIGASAFDPETVEDMTSDIGVVVDLYPTISYDIGDTGLSVSAMGGYSIGQIGEATFDGVTYGAGVEYRITDRYSVGVNYRVIAADFTDFSDETVDIERTTASLKITF